MNTNGNFYAKLGAKDDRGIMRIVGVREGKWTGTQITHKCKNNVQN